MQFDVITTRDMLAEMRKTDRNGNPIPFDVTFVTCDRQRNTGGKVKSLTGAYMNRTELDRTERERKKTGVQYHYRNATRNLKTANGDLTKVHIYLITRFNGMIVL